MAEENTTFVRMNVKSDIKREIDILAASEQRPVYEIVDDMLKLYKAVAIKRATKSTRKVEDVPVADVIATH